MPALLVSAGVAACRNSLMPMYRSARNPVSYSMAAVVANGAKSNAGTRVPPIPSNRFAASSKRSEYPVHDLAFTLRALHC